MQCLQNLQECTVFRCADISQVEHDVSVFILSYNVTQITFSLIHTLKISLNCNNKTPDLQALSSYIMYYLSYVLLSVKEITIIQSTFQNDSWIIHNKECC